VPESRQDQPFTAHVIHSQLLFGLSIAAREDADVEDLVRNPFDAVLEAASTEPFGPGDIVSMTRVGGANVNHWPVFCGIAVLKDGRHAFIRVQSSSSWCRAYVMISRSAEAIEASLLDWPLDDGILGITAPD
jgi:hypothetical protein